MPPLSSITANLKKNRIVVGGDKLTYDQDPRSPAADLLETKLLINSVISDEKCGTRFYTMNLKKPFSA